MKKKLLSLTLAGAVMLSMGTSAFADTVDTAVDGAYGQEITVTTGDVNVPVISLEVPTTVDVVINPYQLEVGEDTNKSSASLISAGQTIVNNSNVDIAVTARVKAELPQGSEAVIATTALKGTEKTKSVFAWMEIVSKASEDAAGTFATAYDSKAAGQVAFTSKETTKASMIKLEKGSETPTYAEFKISGQAASNPDKVWTANDKVNYSITFNFVPQVAAAAGQ